MRAVSGIVRKRKVKKILKMAKGYYGSHSKQMKQAKEAVTRALTYSYRDRRQKKRMMRRLWTLRINGACRPLGISYSKLINGLKKANILLDRKVLSNLAIEDYKAFEAVVEAAKKALA